jgi:hypothetical protein
VAQEEDFLLLLVKLDPIEPVSNFLGGIAGALNRSGVLPLQAGASVLEAVIFQEKVFRKIIRAVLLLEGIKSTTTR